MSVTAEDLCAFLLDLDAPDRLDRPLLLAPAVVSAAVTRLSEALGAAFGHRCAVERLPEGHEHHHNIRAIQALRNEFGGGLQEAILAFHERAEILRRTRPHGCAAGRNRDVA